MLAITLKTVGNTIQVMLVHYIKFKVSDIKAIFIYVRLLNENPEITVRYISTYPFLDCLG